MYFDLHSSQLETHNCIRELRTLLSEAEQKNTKLREENYELMNQLGGGVNFGGGEGGQSGGGEGGQGGAGSGGGPTFEDSDDDDLYS